MEHDDLVDSTTQALLRFRQGGFIPLYSDEEDEPLEHNRIPQIIINENLYNFFYMT